MRAIVNSFLRTPQRSSLLQPFNAPRWDVHERPIKQSRGQVTSFPWKLPFLQTPDEAPECKIIYAVTTYLHYTNMSF